MGMHTVISEGSGGISGGQKQRLMIARAVAPDPKILMLDEATSALDNITQKKVSEALDSLKCTRGVIAHRLSTVRHCDRIIVLDKGKIAEDGTYDELVAAKGIFGGLLVVVSFVMSLLVLKTEKKAQSRAYEIMRKDGLATDGELEMCKKLFRLYNIEYVNDMITALLELIYRVLQIIAYVQNSSSSNEA